MGSLRSWCDTVAVHDALRRYAALSIAAALATMGIKLVAWWLTDSVGLLSDALESSVNLVAAGLLFVALRVAARPADESHPFGHEKIEAFSAASEGLMIIVAAGLIAWQAVARLLEPRDLDQLGLGLAISMLAATINLGVAAVLLRAGREHRSLAPSEHPRRHGRQRETSQIPGRPPKPGA